VKETVPVLFAIQVEAELQLYVEPATLVVTVADEAIFKVNIEILTKKAALLESGFV
jgi:hypothetical protein